MEFYVFVLDEIHVRGGNHHRGSLIKDPKLLAWQSQNDGAIDGHAWL